MNKIIVTIVFCLAAGISVKLQTVNETDKAALEQVNRRVVEAWNAGKLNDAEDLARQALEQAIKIFGGDHEDTAIAFSNLGEIYLAKKDYKKAIENLHPALGIYQRDENRFAQRIAKTAQSLGIAYGYERNEPSAEKYLLMAVAAAEKFYGKENKDILPFIINLRNFYIFSGDFNKADGKFIDHYLIAAKIFAEDSEELEKIDDEHYCFALRNFSPDTAKRRIKRFRESIETGELQDKPDADVTAEGADGAARVVNSKAVTLVKPKYPLKARKVGAGGMIPVKVKIDETGKVIEAKTFCGNVDLREASEKAALKSKFTPTLINGKPIIVIGYILYNFVPARR